MKKSLYVYPWDLADEGIETVLERAKANGLDDIAVAVSYHAGKFLLPHNPVHRVYFPEDGTVYFPVREARYRNSVMKPAVASLVAGRDLMEELADQCRRFDLNLIAWFVGLHNSRLGGKHPGLTARNAYGDSYVYSLCPSRPEVRDYVRAVLSDLVEACTWDRALLESFSYLGFFHGYHHEFYGREPDPWESVLLSLCFCDGCAAAARKEGLDPVRLAADVRESLDRSLAQERGGRIDADSDAKFRRRLPGYPELAAYLNLRCRIVTALLAEARQILKTRNVGMDVCGPVYAPSVELADTEGLDLKAIGELSDHFTLIVSDAPLSEIEQAIEYVKGRIDARKIIASLRLGYGNSSRDDFLARVALVRKHRLYGFNAYHYGTVPLPRLEWLSGGEK